MDSTVYSKLSTGIVATDIYPNIPVNNASLPYLVYQLDGDEPETPLNTTSGPYPYSVTIDVVARHADEAQSLADSVKTLLHGWRDVTAGVQGCFLSGRPTIPEQDADQFYHLQCTFKLFGSQ